MYFDMERRQAQTIKRQRSLERIELPHKSRFCPTTGRDKIGLIIYFYFIKQEEKALPGNKPMKDRLTLFMCGNASGDVKVKQHCSRR